VDSASLTRYASPFSPPEVLRLSDKPEFFPEEALPEAEEDGEDEDEDEDEDEEDVDDPMDGVFPDLMAFIVSKCVLSVEQISSKSVFSAASLA